MPSFTRLSVTRRDTGAPISRSWHDGKGSTAILDTLFKGMSRLLLRLFSSKLEADKTQGLTQPRDEGPTQLMPSTAPLEFYIRRALQDPEAQIFARSSHVTTPTLVKGRVNRIMTYRGSFNPPHQGHKDNLCHEFFRGGSDLNIIAAFVFLLDDAVVRQKYAGSTENVKNYIFTKEERIKLFNNGGIYGGWHWCHPGGMNEQFTFEEKLYQETARDGYTIQIVNLTGCDYLGHEHDDHYFQGNTIAVGTGHPERVNFLQGNGTAHIGALHAVADAATERGAHSMIGDGREREVARAKATHAVS
jgi:hypothetical protein